MITSRFTPEQGYRIESRRGGGGYIMITRAATKKMH
ncbi:MAG: CtsR family transcriptional regulator [Eubacterium sp.]